MGSQKKKKTCIMNKGPPPKKKLFLKIIKGKRNQYLQVDLGLLKTSEVNIFQQM